MSAAKDFPFYNDEPVAISGWGWLLVLAATALGFYLLVGLPEWFEVFPLNYVPPLLFVGLPLAALAYVSKGQLGALFGGYGLKAFGLSVGFMLLTIVSSVVVAILLSRFLAFNANPSVNLLAGMSGSGLALFLSQTFIQLLGEEVVTILPLLAVLWFCVQKLGLSRRAGLVVAVLLSTLWFGALHLPTYDWNLVQCFLVIGSARLVLTAAYLATRNLWVSFGAHLVNDWSIFLLSFAGSHLPIGS